VVLLEHPNDGWLPDNCLWDNPSSIDGFMNHHPQAPRTDAHGRRIHLMCCDCNQIPPNDAGLRCTFCDFKHQRRLAAATRAG